ncbi:MAG: putative 2OG-Fe(II) oxygenase [Myxococcota bacterium]
MSPPPSNELLNLFSVPVGVCRDVAEPALLELGVDWILGERERDPGIHVSNAGGWHSRPDLPNREEPVLDALFGSMVEEVRRFHGRVCQPPDAPDAHLRIVLQAWATVMERGDHVHVHDHADAHWSAVLYLDAGEMTGETDGRLSWINPSGGHRNPPGRPLSATSFHLTPEAGLLVIFPGWLRHSVFPYAGTRPRVALAANFELAPRRGASSGG